jgi:DNA invertase Pin-like site-specific DNA recombinase
MPENYAGSKMMKRVIELIRVSTEGQAGPDRAGIAAQRAANRRTATHNGLEIVRTIEISDVSGAAVLRSPGMQELLKLIESVDIQGVVAKEFSRLMRPDNFADYALLQAFADTATVLYLPDGPIDLGSKSGRLFGPLRAAIAGLERTEILERVWAAKEEKRRAGKHPQSQIALPYGVGYERRNNRWYFKDEASKVLTAFRSFLSGETSYTEVGREVGINPFSLRVILRNPIYTGWRVYSKRRDPSPKAMRTRSDGRQADRPKIQREPEDIIRVKVLDPLLSIEDFERVQQILNLKKQNHWRARPDHQRRFTYSGFLKCAVCGNLVYTHASKNRDWYVCKARTWPERILRQKKSLPPCTNQYMRRERLESNLDTIFSERLTNRGILDRIALELLERSGSPTSMKDRSRLQRIQRRLQNKRKRLLDAYFDELLARAELDHRLKEMRAEEHLCEQDLQSTESATPKVSAAELAKILEPLTDWEFLSRNEKRLLLQTVIPEIHIENYGVTKLALLLPDRHRDEITHTDKDSWPRRA